MESREKLGDGDERVSFSWLVCFGGGISIGFSWTSGKVELGGNSGEPEGLTVWFKKSSFSCSFCRRYSPYDLLLLRFLGLGGSGILLPGFSLEGVFSMWNPFCFWSS